MEEKHKNDKNQPLLFHSFSHKTSTCGRFLSSLIFTLLKIAIIQFHIYTISSPETTRVSNL